MVKKRKMKKDRRRRNQKGKEELLGVAVEEEVLTDSPSPLLLNGGKARGKKRRRQEGAFAESCNSSPTSASETEARTSDALQRLQVSWCLRTCLVEGCHCSRFHSHEHELKPYHCSGCGHSIACHDLERFDSEESSAEVDALRRAFVLLRAARSLGTSGTSLWGESFFAAPQVKKLARRAVAMLGTSPGATTFLHDRKLTIRKINQAVELMSSGQYSGSAALSVTAALDEAYLHLYYAALRMTCYARVGFDAQHARVGMTMDVVPPPELYFAALTHCPPLKQDVRALVHSLPAGSKIAAHLSRVWAMNLAGEGPMDLPFDSNPLLAVLHATWAELAVSARAPSWLPGLSHSAGPDDGTLRGVDPLMPAALREHCDSIRDWSARLYAFAVPTNAVCEALSQAGVEEVIEMGGGLGYWKRFMKFAGMEVVALDSDPVSHVRGSLAIDSISAPSSTRRLHNEYHGSSPSWSVVHSGTVNKLGALASPMAALLCCYPPPEGSFGADLLRTYRGSIFVYVGEPAGDTGTQAMHKALAQSWTLQKRVELPCFPNTAAECMIFLRKNVQHSVSMPLTMCAACRQPSTRLCRRTRALSFCSAKCCASASGQERMQVALALRHLLSDQPLQGAEAFLDGKVFRPLQKK
jgi:hypothetical protein